MEYREAVHLRYMKASKREKGKILDEFIQVTGYHRKAAIRLLNRNSIKSNGNAGDAVGAMEMKQWMLCARYGKPVTGYAQKGCSHSLVRWSK